MAVEFKLLNDNIFINSTSRIKDGEYDGLVNLNCCNFIKTLTNVSQYVSYGNTTYSGVSIIIFSSGKEQFVWIYNNLTAMQTEYDEINNYLKNVTKFSTP